jgi:hypothetical protein
MCQRQNDNILREYLGKFIIYYLDDILVYLEYKKDYKKYISLVLEALSKVDSRLKLSKYKFSIQRTLFLGYVIELEKISIDPEKIR